ELKVWEEKGDFGIINTKNNFWGKNTTKEMKEKGFGNKIDKIFDYFYDPKIHIDNKDYARDKVDFRDWETKEIKILLKQ
ncbi:hypothetical protein HY745_03290, partial [Candidatus Desantisbacteria bacterium]|nr:hypothetical protein [Candidatus Desantisbacteria bacterium]